MKESRREYVDFQHESEFQNIDSISLTSKTTLL